MTQIKTIKYDGRWRGEKRSLDKIIEEMYSEGWTLVGPVQISHEVRAQGNTCDTIYLATMIKQTT